MTELFDVIAVNLVNGTHRLLAESKSEPDADAIVAMAVARRGVEDEFFKAVPHGDAAAVEVLT